MGCGASSQPVEEDKKTPVDAGAANVEDKPAPAQPGQAKAAAVTSLIVTGAPASGKGKLIKEVRCISARRSCLPCGFLSVGANA